MNSFFQMLLRFYQITISPLYPPCCRYLPTCSEYARQAFALHGVCIGTKLTLARLFRCHPFCCGGYDPVPPSKKTNTNEPITHEVGKNG